MWASPQRRFHRALGLGLMLEENESGLNRRYMQSLQTLFSLGCSLWLIEYRVSQVLLRAVAPRRAMGHGPAWLVHLPDGRIGWSCGSGS